MVTHVVEALVDSDWLMDNLDSPNIIVVDGPWHLPTMRRNPSAEFESAHIPGAVFFDIDHIADTESSLPHMIPRAEEFAIQVSALGINNDDHVIAYDTTGVGSAARVWWMFRLFGHEHVSVLNGGLPAWQRSGGSMTKKIAPSTTTDFSARLNKRLLRTIDELKRNVKNDLEQILDARSYGRFTGKEPEPRPGLRSGHIPNSLNLPFPTLYDSETKLMKSDQELMELFSKAGVKRNKPVVTSCGSGITACNLALGLHLIGRNDVAIYDGSWTEWGGRLDTPIENRDQS